MLALLQNIAGLNEATTLLEEIIIINNCSTQDYNLVTDYIHSQPQLPILYLIAPSNLGVAKGRNYGLALGKAPIIIMLDDDAELQNKDCLQLLLQEFEKHTINERTTAILSFKVLYYDTLLMQQNALPHKQYNAYKDKVNFETYYFAGGAHAIKRSVLTHVGNYPEQFFYGMEEYDLSYRILDAGYSIGYTSKVVMLHKESPLGRQPKEEKIRMMWVNKTVVAYTYLPKIYTYTTAILWSIQYLKLSSFNVNGCIHGYKQIYKALQLTQRMPISTITLQYLKKLNARLWY